MFVDVLTGCERVKMPKFLKISRFGVTYPRACAMAEVTWTDPKLRKWEDFRNRLDTHLQRLRAQGVNYRRARPTDKAPGNSKP